MSNLRQLASPSSERAAPARRGLSAQANRPRSFRASARALHRQAADREIPGLSALHELLVEVMQDDCYLIAADGWVAKPERILVKTERQGKGQRLGL